MVLGEIDKDSGNVQAREPMARSLVEYVEEIPATRITALGKKEQPKFDSARRLRGIYVFDPEDMDFQRIHEKFSK